MPRSARTISQRALPVDDWITAHGYAAGRGFVNDDGARGALARGFLELVGPAPVIGHGAAAEAAIVAGFEIGIVDQDHGDLAAHVDAFVIVPVRVRAR